MSVHAAADELTHAGIRPAAGWSRRFPAVPARVGAARSFAGSVLAGCPAAEDAALCLSELATNAVLHSRSAARGGYFTVSVRHGDGGIRVAVTDQGGNWGEPAQPGGQHGRGLVIVSQVASAWGRSGSREAGWTVWFALDCP